jgi:hypothetical protein
MSRQNTPGPRYYTGTIVAVRSDTFLIRHERKPDSILVPSGRERLLRASIGPRGVGPVLSF